MTNAGDSTQDLFIEKARAASWSMRRTCRPSEFDDEEQDALLGAWQAVADWERLEARRGGEAGLGAFLLTAARRAIIDGRRARHGRKGTRPKTEPLAEWSGARESHELKAVEVADEARAVLAATPPKAAEVLVLVFAEGLTQREAAARAGLSQATVAYYCRGSKRTRGEGAGT